MKKIMWFCVVVTVFVFCNIIYYSITNVDYYNESELTSNLVNDKIKEEIYEYIKKFDKDIILSLQVCDNSEEGLSSEQIVDITIKYILSNKEEYKENIFHFENEYAVSKDGTIYYSNGYVDKVFFLNIVKKLFATNDIDVDDSIYYDKNRGLVALLLIYGDVSAYKEAEITHFQELDYYNYTLSMNYYVSDTCSFKIKYYVERNEFNEYGKYKLNKMTIN